MMYLEFMKSFLADSSELMRVRVILAYWAQKLFNSHFLDMMYVELIKNFFLADSRELMGVRVISNSWARKRLIPLSRHDVPRVHEKFFLADSSELMGVRVISASWAQKRFDSQFLDMMYVEFIKKFFLADSRELMGVRVILASWAQKRLIPTL